INFFKEYPIRKFIFGNEWISLSGKFGVLPLLVGTFWITFIALIIAVPFGIMTSLYINEYATKKVRKYLKICVETMAAIPSVVLGFIGLSVFSIPIKRIFSLNTGLTALTGGIMLAFMAIPTIVSFSDDALESLDKSYKEASFALGANRLETLIKILIPAAFPGIFAGIMLGFGRIVGETMAVLMITGNSPIMAKSPLSPVRALTATIASEMGEVVQGSTHYYALFAIGLVLFIISFATTSIADIYVRKSRKLMGK
ncbi:MAG: phosphate ABC transporter permease subunit PstC, partial [Fusobacteriaceae bacterium]